MILKIKEWKPGIAMKEQTIAVPPTWVVMLESTLMSLAKEAGFDDAAITLTAEVSCSLTRSVEIPLVPLNDAKPVERGPDPDISGVTGSGRVVGGGK